MSLLGGEFIRSASFSLDFRRNVVREVLLVLFAGDSSVSPLTAVSKESSLPIDDASLSPASIARILNAMVLAYPCIGTRPDLDVLEARLTALKSS
jgi:hypothetical protein